MGRPRFTHLQTLGIHAIILLMNTVKIYRLDHLSRTLFGRLKVAQMEAAQAWNLCMHTHKAARQAHAKWPGRNELQKATKARFALHSQSVQMVGHAFLANVETTRQLRKTHPQMRMKYPWRTKRFYPVCWPREAVSYEPGLVILPMGRGRASLILPLDLPENSGACRLVWNQGFELHVCVEIPQAEHAPGSNQATVDLGENPPGGGHDQYGPGDDRHRTGYPFPQTTTHHALEEDHQEASLLQEAFGNDCTA